jgi:hypothetical protein
MGLEEAFAESSPNPNSQSAVSPGWRWKQLLRCAVLGALTLLFVTAFLPVFRKASTAARVVLAGRQVPACERHLTNFLVSLRLEQYAVEICGQGYTRLDDVLHLSSEQCAVHLHMALPLAAVCTWAAEVPRVHVHRMMFAAGFTCTTACCQPSATMCAM